MWRRLQVTYVALALKAAATLAGSDSTLEKTGSRFDRIKRRNRPAAAAMTRSWAIPTT